MLVQATSGIWIPTAWPLVPPALLLLGVILAAILVVRRSDLAIVQAAAALLLAFVLGYQHAWEHHYSGVILAGVLGFVELSRSSAAATHRRAALLGGALLFLALPSPYALAGARFEQWTLGTWLLMSLSKAIPTAIALYTLLAPSTSPNLAQPRPTSPNLA